LRTGTLFFVVGPSGSGKDSLIDGARAVLEPTGRYVFARRVITRPRGAAGEDHLPATASEFSHCKSRGDFLITWSAHGLEYGLRRELTDALERGQHVVANGSRAAISELGALLSRLIVVEVTAPSEILEQRIAKRGREEGELITRRLTRSVPRWSNSIRTVTVSNDGTLAAGIERFLSALESHSSYMQLRRLPLFTGRDHCAYLPAQSNIVNAHDYLGSGKIEISNGSSSVRTRVQVMDCPDLLNATSIGLSSEAFEELGLAEWSEVTIRRTPSPESRSALMEKIHGGSLSEDQYDMLIRDIVESRYPDSEVAAFLVAASQNLADEEVLSLARVRTRFSERMTWSNQIVVDKHSMGGVPGSRITLIVVPIVAAHGAFVMPKTSSRAITSAAGTADAMEALANVELAPEQLRRCVEVARACIAWNGRLNHSIVDDVMNSITRPLGIDSNRWSVASILSKKFTSGSTHVIVDLPFGAHTKLKTEEAAKQLAGLFESVGRGLGLTVSAFPTDGSRPIGRGIGPALEARDVRWILSNHPDAPADLTEKALFFASRILAWDPEIGDVIKGRRRAEELLSSGAALEAFNNIVDAQGRRSPPVDPGHLVQKVLATSSGKIVEIDGWAIGSIARRAGAPYDKSAGVDLLRHMGDSVAAGDPLFAIHSSTTTDLDEARKLAESDSCFIVA
jgi:thymidine phosphorylase